MKRARGSQGLADHIRKQWLRRKSGKHHRQYRFRVLDFQGEIMRGACEAPRNRKGSRNPDRGGIRSAKEESWWQNRKIVTTISKGIVRCKFQCLGGRNKGKRNSQGRKQKKGRNDNGRVIGEKKKGLFDKERVASVEKDVMRFTQCASCVWKIRKISKITKRWKKGLERGKSVLHRRMNTTHCEGKEEVDF